MEIENFTPLHEEISPSKEVHRLLFHKLFVMFFGLIFLVGVLMGGWYLYSNTGLLASTNENEQPSPVAAASTPIPSPSTMVEQPPVGLDWKRQLNNECGVTFFIPPAEEPYLIPR
ncbi:MAG: hypothetical protein O3B87_05935, partial [bacterium]|nr:hypothetical protein [bacterium]